MNPERLLCLYIVQFTKIMGHKTLLCFITFCMSRRQRKMYCANARLCVCLSVRGRTPTLLHRPGCNLGACGMVEAAP